MSPSNVVRVAIPLLVLSGAAPAAALSYGSAQGSLVIGAERYELRHAYALHERSIYERGGGGSETTTLVLLVDQEIDPSVIAYSKPRSKAVETAKVHGVLVQIEDESGEVEAQVLLAPGTAAEVAGDDAANWVRGEFTNRSIWGALGSDGELDLDEGRTWRYEAFFAAEFAPPPAGSLAANTAQGAFQVGAKSVPLTHARAYLETVSEEETHTVVLLSSAPVDLDTARDAEALRAAAAGRDKLTALRLWIHDQEGSLLRQEWYTPQGAAPPESTEGLRWASWEFATDSIRGFLTTDGTRQAGRTKWQLDVHFAAPIEGVPPAAEGSD